MGCRPQDEVDALLEEVLVELAGGSSLRDALDKLNVSRSVFARRLARDEIYRERYLDAKRAGILMEFERMRDMYDDLRVMLKDTKLHPDDKKVRVQAVRNEIDMVKWALTKLAPKVFGEAIAAPQASTAHLTIDLKPEGK